MKTEANKKTRQFAGLGYSHLDTAEIVTHLNQLLADYHILFHKLRNYHWHVAGADFFELHNEFELMYDQVYRNTDEIAEKIRLFGKKPFATMREYLDRAKIKEGKADFTPMEMVKDILNNLQILLTEMEEGIYSAQHINDFGTEDMLKSFIRMHEKHYWFLSSWLNQIIV